MLIKPKVILFGLILLLLSACISAYAGQNPYIKNGSIGSKATSPINIKVPTPFLHTEIKYWQGLELVFLPVSEYGGYMGSIEYGDFCLGSYSSNCHRPRFEELAGVIGKVSYVPSDGLYNSLIHIQVPGISEPIIAAVDSGRIRGVVLRRDIDNARRLYIGKTLYPKVATLMTYDQSTDSIGELKIKKYQPLKVVDVVLNSNSDQPIRFIVKGTSGTGYRDINISDTNHSGICYGECKFDGVFLAADPKLKYHWGIAAWKAIQDEQVYRGMNKSQVKMSWGEPREINTTSTNAGEDEQWVYDGGYIYLRNRIVYAIQN